MAKIVQQLDVNVLGQNWRIDLSDYVEMEDPKISHSMQDDTLYLDEDTVAVIDDTLKINPVLATVERETLILNI